MTQEGRTGNSSRDPRGTTESWLRIPPASCSNHGRDGVRPLLRNMHCAGLPRFSKVPHPVGGDSGQGHGLSRWDIPDDGERLYSHPKNKQRNKSSYLCPHILFTPLGCIESQTSAESVVWRSFLVWIKIWTSSSKRLWRSWPPT